MNEQLLALAEHDEAIVRVRHSIDHPHAAATYDEAVATLEALGHEARELEAIRAPLAERVVQLDKEATTARDRAGVIAARLEASTGAGRDLTAMDEERAALATRASELEDDQLALLEELEPLEAAIASLRARGTQAVTRRDEAAGALASERAANEAELAALRAARVPLAEALEPSLLARYDVIAARVGGSGAARLVDGRCGGCRVAVPAALADRLLHSADPDAMVTCDECGRLLVR